MSGFGGYGSGGASGGAPAAVSYVNFNIRTTWGIIPTYGNYGGENYTGGEVGGNNFTLLGDNTLDEAFKAHDQAYSDAATAADPAAARRDADRALLDRLATFEGRPEHAALHANDRAYMQHQ